MRKGLVVVLLIAMASCSVARETRSSRPIDWPEDALRLLSESTSEPCGICVERMRKKAFQALEGAFRPGEILRSDGSCLFVRTDACGENELALTCYPAKEGPGKGPGDGETPFPTLTFRFHTAAAHLVGVSASDFTEEQFLNEYLSAPAGSVFEGMLSAIEYKYGDGASYNYHPERNHLQVHCKILSLRRVEVSREIER